MHTREVGGAQADAERIMPVEPPDLPSPDALVRGPSDAGTFCAAAGDELDFGSAGSRWAEADDGRAGGWRCP
jgi:hypothetical protein